MNGHISEHNFDLGDGINLTYEELINRLRSEIATILTERIDDSGYVSLLPLNLLKADLRSANPLLNAEAE